MAKKKVKLTLEMSFNTYSIIRDAVEGGVRCGLRRCQKYLDKPDDDDLEPMAQHIEDGVMNALEEVVKWPED